MKKTAKGKVLATGWLLLDNKGQPEFENGYIKVRWPQPAFARCVRVNLVRAEEKKHGKT